MNFSPFSILYQNIAATMLSLGLAHADEAAFKTWAYSAWIDSGFTQHHAVFSQPASSTKIQFDVRVAVSGHRVNVWWGDGSSNSYTPGTSSDTACAKTYETGALRPVVIIGRVKEFRSGYADGRTTFGGRVQGFGSALTYLSVGGNNTLSGAVTGLTSLTYLGVQGNNTLSGSVTGLTSLTTIYVQGNNTLSGVITGLTSLTAIYVQGNNTLSGSVTGLTSLTYLSVQGNNTLSGWENAATTTTGLCYFH